jgi:hypothetical protein
MDETFQRGGRKERGGLQSGRAATEVAAGLRPAVEGGILSPGPAFADLGVSAVLWLNPLGRMPRSTAARMAAATKFVQLARIFGRSAPVLGRRCIHTPERTGLFADLSHAAAAAAEDGCTPTQAYSVLAAALPRCVAPSCPVPSAFKMLRLNVFA